LFHSHLNAQLLRHRGRFPIRTLSATPSACFTKSPQSRFRWQLKKQFRRLHDEIVRILKTDTVKNKLASLGFAVIGSTPAELADA
jgi:hypothetical protein